MEGQDSGLQSRLVRASMTGPKAAGRSRMRLVPAVVDRTNCARQYVSFSERPRTALPNSQRQAFLARLMLPHCQE